MPELPEVQTIVNTLAPHAVEAKIDQLILFRQDIVDPPQTNLAEKLRGRTIATIYRRGKRIIFVLDDGRRFLIQLGMTGQLTVRAADFPPLRHTHLIFKLSKTVPSKKIELHFCDPRRFGGVRWLDGATGDDGLGIEPFDLTVQALRDILQNHRRQIKTILLEQKLIAGIGNIYADESLFGAGIHPQRKSDSIDHQATIRLHHSIISVLRNAIAHKGSSVSDIIDANGDMGSFQHQHFVYAREGQSCRVCRTTIQRVVIAQRSSCFCPQCQAV